MEAERRRMRKGMRLRKASGKGAEMTNRMGAIRASHDAIYGTGKGATAARAGISNLGGRWNLRRKTLPASIWAPR